MSSGAQAWRDGLTRDRDLLAKAGFDRTALTQRLLEIQEGRPGANEWLKTKYGRTRRYGRGDSLYIDLEVSHLAAAQAMREKLEQVLCRLSVVRNTIECRQQGTTTVITLSLPRRPVKPRKPAAATQTAE